MKTLIATAAAFTVSLGLAAAAHAQSPQIPTPVNPYPINPVATNGTPLPSQSNAVRSGGVGPYGTSYGAGVGGAVAAPFNFVGQVAGAGVGAADGIVGAGLGVAGAR